MIKDMMKALAMMVITAVAIPAGYFAMAHTVQFLFFHPVIALAVGVLGVVAIVIKRHNVHIPLPHFKFHH